MNTKTFRNRDIVALVLALILARMTWNDAGESITSSAQLAFFYPRDKAMAVSPMDVDGDGTNEAMVLVKPSSTSSSTEAAVWEFEIVDLKPLHQYSKTYLAPFRPNVLFTAQQEVDNSHIVPIKMTSGQVVVRKRNGGSSSSSGANKSKKSAMEYSGEYEINERTRHYFCGVDWHTAASNCGTPCPGGLASECPGDEKCFADTPCDVLNPKKSSLLDGADGDNFPLHLTPGGGLPSIVTLWSDGGLMLHSLTNDKEPSEDPDDASSETSTRDNKKATSIGDQQQLKIKEIWNQNVMPFELVVDEILWEESNILFLDAYSSDGMTGAEHGMIIVSASYYNQATDPPERTSFIIAVNALTGETLWDSFLQDEKLQSEPLPLPLVRGPTSHGRRRSRVPSLREDHYTGAASVEKNTLPNCMVTLKHHLADILPYGYWGPKDASLSAIHIDQSTKRHGNRLGPGSGGAASAAASNSFSVGLDGSVASSATDGEKRQHNAAVAKRKSHHFHKGRNLHHNRGNGKHPIYGRPNVIVSQTRGGVYLRSLKNGMALCHLSFLEETLYSDLNNDGILDQVQILTDTKKTDPRDKFMWDLVSKVQQERQKVKEKMAAASGANRKKNYLDNDHHLLSTNNLCHAMALTGLPAREQLFSVSLCGRNGKDIAAGPGGSTSAAEHNPTLALDSISPLVVESLVGRRDTRDIVIALNNGSVQRLSGRRGRREWMLTGGSTDKNRGSPNSNSKRIYHYGNDFPTWEQGSNHQNAILTRVYSDKIPSPIRPLLLIGENSMSIISVKTGELLTTVQFPQTSIQRPIFTDMTGDGTIDVMTISIDAIWGYQIHAIRHTRAISRIFVGVLFMGLMLAYLRNHTNSNNNSKKDTRASDE